MQHTLGLARGAAIIAALLCAPSVATAQEAGPVDRPMPIERQLLARGAAEKAFYTFALCAIVGIGGGWIARFFAEPPSVGRPHKETPLQRWPTRCGFLFGSGFALVLAGIALFAYFAHVQTVPPDKERLLTQVGAFGLTLAFFSAAGLIAGARLLQLAR